MIVLSPTIPQSNPQKTFVLTVNTIVELKGFPAFQQGIGLDPKMNT